jgi:hypothetical protein
MWLAVTQCSDGFLDEMFDASNGELGFNVKSDLNYSSLLAMDFLNREVIHSEAMSQQTLEQMLQLLD